MRYILDVSSQFTAKHLITAVHQYAPELKEIAMTAADQLRQEGREQGRRNQVAMLATLLTQRFGPLLAPHRDRLDRASSDQLRDLASQVLSVNSVDELFAGFDPEHE